MTSLLYGRQSPPDILINQMEFKGHKYTKGIFWLPKRSAIDRGLLLDVDIPTGAYNHPVLILSHKPGGRGYLDMVELLIVRWCIIPASKLKLMAGPQTAHQLPPH